MTCIVGIAKNKKVFMGGDSCGATSASYVACERSKVFTIETGTQTFLIGGAGSFRMLDILEYDLEIDRPYPGVTDDQFMRTNFINCVRGCFKKNGLSSLQSEESAPGPFLVGFKGNLYKIQYDYSVLNCPKLGYSIGSGSDPARGSLFTTWSMKKKETPEKRIKIALDSAESVNPFVRSPMYIKSL